MVTAAQAYWLNRKRRQKRAASEGVGATVKERIVALFGGTAGFMFDPSDLTTLFQSGTRGAPGTAVSADGDPVGLHLDLSPNQFDREQATSAARPLYKTSGGLDWLFYQGTDDRLTNAAAQLPLTDFTYIDAFEETTSVLNAGVFVAHPASGNDFDRTDALSMATGNGARFTVAASTSVSLVLTEPGTKPIPVAVREVVKNGASSTLYVNGVSTATDNSFTAFDPLSAGGFTMGRRIVGGAGSQYLIGRERFSFFIGRVLTDAERTLVRNYAAELAGVTL